jgi:DNA-binding transcriptional MocR family regulator
MTACKNKKCSHATDTNALVERALAEDIVLAQGSLFSPSQLPSTRMRLNGAAMQEPRIWTFLEKELVVA